MDIQSIGHPIYWTSNVLGQLIGPLNHAIYSIGHSIHGHPVNWLSSELDFRALKHPTKWIANPSEPQLFRILIHQPIHPAQFGPNVRKRKCTQGLIFFNFLLCGFFTSQTQTLKWPFRKIYRNFLLGTTPTFFCTLKSSLTLSTHWRKTWLCG